MYALTWNQQSRGTVITGSLPSGYNPPFQVGVMSLEDRRALTIEYCTSSKVFKDNGAWCLRDRTPRVEFAPGHSLTSKVCALSFLCVFAHLGHSALVVVRLCLIVS
jgi:hypothetical protein